MLLFTWIFQLVIKRGFIEEKLKKNCMLIVLNGFIGFQ